ncbi:hypothetical protein [Spirillospora sp. CA-294931]|uniref:hypothetical protein n=1 Tax=Spirillospora sp. CA-294931 TaxID=3240042 RepID=UPI003D8F07CD
MESRNPTDDEIKQQVNEAVRSFSGTFMDIEDPATRGRALTALLEAIPDLQADLRGARQSDVLQLRRAGLSHAEVGAAIGTSRGRAAQIADGRAGGKEAKREPISGGQGSHA